VLAALACLCAPLAGWSAELTEAPRWEAGAGLGAVTFPVYRGAAESDTWPVPIPYFVYRGSVLRADRSGVNAVFVDEPRLRMDLSANASPPVRSSHAPVRHGMEDLRPTAEFGPSLEAWLWQSADARARLSVHMPVRAALTLEASPRAVGLVGGVYLNFDRMDAFGRPGWALGVRAGPSFQSRRYDAYYYSVRPDQATAERAEYSAPGGYAGATAVLSLSKRFARHWFGAFVRYDTLAGAAFADSPLVESRHYLAAGIGFVWVLAAAADSVPVDRVRLERARPSSGASD
jgi:outer membrane scaffolding protein for murein synthesis (MipA/OmpV family)